MAKMTKSQLLATLADKLKVSKKYAENVVTVFTDLVLSEVKKNGEFTIPGIGKLVKMKRKARIGRNPATGASIKIPAKTVVKFRVAKATKDALL